MARKVGRPSSYKKEHCETLIKHMSDGFSYESFAGLIQADTHTVYSWEQKYPEFLHAKRRGVAACRLWWEKIGHMGLVGKVKGFSNTIWVFSMKNRFGWRDLVDVRTDDGASEANPLKGYVFLEPTDIKKED